MATARVADSIRPGDDWVFPLTFENADGTPVDVSGWAFPAPTFRETEHAESPVVATASVSMANAADGIVLYSCAGAITAQWLDRYSRLVIDLPRTAPSRKTWCVVDLTVEGDSSRV